LNTLSTPRSTRPDSARPPATAPPSSVADHADGSAVYALAGKLADEVVGGDRPTPAGEANETAERVLDDRAYTDGGA